MKQARPDIQLTNDIAYTSPNLREILQRRLGGENWQMLPTLEEYDSVDEWDVKSRLLLALISHHQEPWVRMRSAAVVH